LSSAIYYAKNIVAGSNTVTVTFNTSAAYPNINVTEYSGLDTTSPLDVAAGATGIGTTGNSGSATTTSANELIVGSGNPSTVFTAAGSGFTSRIINSFGGITEDKVVTSTGSFNATATLTSGNWVMQMATFRAGSGASYDADGNLLSDTFHTYTWNVDNQPVTVDAIALTYDAFGRVVEKNNGGIYSQYLYDVSGAKLATMSGGTLSTGLVPLPGGVQAVFDPANSGYRIPDWLGSVRFASKSNRTYNFSLAFAPFGERYSTGVTAPANYTFTGMINSTVSDEYDFPARSLQTNQGRWISPDTPGAVDIANPQSFNRYAYANGNPVLFTDPSGNDPDDPNPCGPVAAYAGGGCDTSGGEPFNPNVNVKLPYWGNGGPDDIWNTGPGKFSGPYFADSPFEFAQDDANAIVSGTNASLSWNTASNFPTAPTPGSRLANGDVAVGIDIFRNSAQCPTCGTFFNSANTWVNAAAVGTGVVLVGVPLAGEVGASSFGDFLLHEAVYNPATNGVESGLLNTAKVARYGWGRLAYGIVPTWSEAGTLTGPRAAMYVLRAASGGGSLSWWIHFPNPF
jgi:RHS repeat-associated protein